MKKIDVGSGSFEKLITFGNLYVDKTKFIYDLVNDGGTYYFLSRPRRFGKTLTVSTLESVFDSRRDLFKGLYISFTDYDWKRYPVLRFDFSKAETQSAYSLSRWLKWKMSAYAISYGLEIDGNMGVKSNLDALLTGIFEKEREKIVILVDEYDKPLSDNISNSDVESVRDVVKGFFETIKASCDYLRFVLITGVTGYAKVSIFSSMNNLMDLSMDRRFAGMFGYSQRELEDSFAEYIGVGLKSTGLSRCEYIERLRERDMTDIVLQWTLRPYTTQCL